MAAVEWRRPGAPVARHLLPAVSPNRPARAQRGNRPRGQGSRRGVPRLPLLLRRRPRHAAVRGAGQQHCCRCALRSLFLCLLDPLAHCRCIMEAQVTPATCTWPDTRLVHAPCRLCSPARPPAAAHHLQAPRCMPAAPAASSACCVPCPLCAGWSQGVQVSASVDAYYPLGPAACCTPTLLLASGCDPLPTTPCAACLIRREPLQGNDKHESNSPHCRSGAVCDQTPSGAALAQKQSLARSRLG
jgi:hypothetical protein